MDRTSGPPVGLAVRIAQGIRSPTILNRMGRQRRSPTTSAEPDLAEATPGSERFTFVEDERGGVTVMRDGHPQSHVDLDDPLVIEFEYVQHFALVMDALLPTLPTALRVTHIGGAGLTLARYVEATRPGSPQIVLEPDEQLTEAVRRELPLPRGHRIRVRGIDGARGIAALRDASADVIVLDAFADGQVPGELVSPTFAAEVSGVLAPGGLLLANLSDEPGFAWTGRAIATFTDRLPHAAVIAAHEVLKGKRFGNVVLAAARKADALDVQALRRGAARAMFPTGVRAGTDLRRLVGDTRPFTDADAAPSPPPPDLGAWRVR